MIKSKLFASFLMMATFLIINTDVSHAQTLNNSSTVSSNFTGIIQKDSDYYYMSNGSVSLTSNGIVLTDTGTFYIVNGKVNQTLIGLIPYNNAHLYIKNGKWEEKFSGLVTNPAGTYYVKQGKIDRSFTGFIWYENAHYYIVNGRWASNYTGLGINSAGTYYVKQGKIDRSFTGFVWYENAHYYIVNGRWASNYTGLGTNSAGTYYVKQGKIDRLFTGFVWHENEHYYMVNGRWASHYTGLGSNPVGSYYVKQGKIDRSFTEFITSTNQENLYFKNGKLQFRISLVNINQTKGSYDIIISNENVQNDIKQVLVPTWTEKNGQDDIIWGIATKENNVSYRYTVKMSDHNYENGFYASHVYIITSKGTLEKIAEKNTNLNKIFVNPIDNPRMTSWFGESRYLILQDGRIRRDIHNGVDFVNGNRQAQIKAVASGAVIYSGWRGSAGRAVIIKHADDLYTYYYHLSSIHVNVNDIVAQNQVLGIIGTTGDSTGIHLHFGVSRKLASHYFDPMLMLPELK